MGSNNAMAQTRDVVRSNKPFSSTIPISQPTQKEGCYVLAIETQESLPQQHVFWHRCQRVSMPGR